MPMTWNEWLDQASAEERAIFIDDLTTECPFALGYTHKKACDEYEDCNKCWEEFLSSQYAQDARVYGLPERDDALKALARAEQERKENPGEISDGYHTFNELYHHRAVLFSVICNEHSQIAWKSLHHHKGGEPMYDGMFIVGINTSRGQATYHYNIDPYWDMFGVPELDNAPKWDGHTPAEAIERIASLSQEENDTRPIFGYPVQHLARVAYMMRKHGVTPEDVKRCSDNWRFAYELALEASRKDIDEQVRKIFPTEEGAE